MDRRGLREDRWLLLAGAAGLAMTFGFAACSGSTDTSTSSDGGSGGTGGATSTSGTGTTTGTTGTGGSGGSTSAGCTASASTAENAAAVLAAAQALAAKLTTTQQSTIQLSATLDNSEQWSNLPTNFIPRNGVMIGDMSADAQAAAVALVAVAAGTQGSKLFTELRAADEWLVTDGKASSDGYGEGRYYIAFVGTPSASSSWMLQVAGHHLAYNFTYNGKCTSATPLFDGVEPTSWTDGTTTHAPLENQRAASVAVIDAIKGDAASLLADTYTDVVNGPTNANSKGDAHYPQGLKYPTGTTGRGVLVGSLSADKQALVMTAIEAWVKNVADPVSSALLSEYESAEALDQTYVAYSGQADLTAKNGYFRIDGPRVWIEYTIQGGIVYQNKVHYHTLWRDKAADYGAEYADSDAGADSTTTSTGAGGPSGGGPGMGGGPPGAGGGPPDGGL